MIQSLFIPGPGSRARVATNPDHRHPGDRSTGTIDRRGPQSLDRRPATQRRAGGRRPGKRVVRRRPPAAAAAACTSAWVGSPTGRFARR